MLGRVVNVVSLGGRFTFDNGGVYCMSKHSMIAFSDALRREMRKFGVHVVTLEPGLFKTAMTSGTYMTDLSCNTWELSEPDVKKSYGKSYLEEQLKCVNRFHETFRSGDNIDIVVDDMIDAIQNCEPRVRYLPIQGLTAKVTSLMAAYIPTELLDQILSARDQSRPELEVNNN